MTAPPLKVRLRPRVGQQPTTSGGHVTAPPLKAEVADWGGVKTRIIGRSLTAPPLKVFQDSVAWAIGIGRSRDRPSIEAETLGC